MGLKKIHKQNVEVNLHKPKKIVVSANRSKNLACRQAMRHQFIKHITSWGNLVFHAPIKNILTPISFDG
jgi:hypothetical protein